MPSHPFATLIVRPVELTAIVVPLSVMSPGPRVELDAYFANALVVPEMVGIATQPPAKPVWLRYSTPVLRAVAVDPGVVANAGADAVEYAATSPQLPPISIGPFGYEPMNV